MDKEKDKKQKTVKTDYSAKKRMAEREKAEREKRFNIKAAEALKGFLKDNIVD